jgi:hypothetical protein
MPYGDCLNLLVTVCKKMAADLIALHEALAAAEKSHCPNRIAIQNKALWAMRSLHTVATTVKLCKEL